MAAAAAAAAANTATTTTWIPASEIDRSIGIWMDGVEASVRASSGWDTGKREALGSGSEPSRVVGRTTPVHGEPGARGGSARVHGGVGPTCHCEVEGGEEVGVWTRCSGWAVTWREAIGWTAWREVSGGSWGAWRVATCRAADRWGHLFGGANIHLTCRTTVV